MSDESSITVPLFSVRGDCDQVYAYDLVMGALSDEVAPLFPVADTVDASATDPDVEPLFKSGDLIYLSWKAQ